MTKLVLKIYNLLKDRVFLRFSLLIGLFVVFGFFASKLQLDEDISSFLPKDEHSEKINFVYKNIGLTDKIVIRISGKNSDQTISKDSLIEVADCFTNTLDSLTAGKNVVQTIFSKIDQEKIMGITQFITNNVPYFLNETDYARLDTLLTPEKIKQTLENNKKILVSPAGIVLKKNLLVDPLHLSGSTLGRLKDFQVSDQYITYNDYIFSEKKSDLLIFVTTAYSSNQTAKNELLVSYLDQAIQQTQHRYDKLVKLTYFGAGPIAVSNARQIKTDSYWAISISVILILLLLIWFFKDIKSILLLAVPVLFGGLMSLAALYFLKGTISAIAVGAGSIIFGIAINYSLHFLIHKKHEPDPEKSLKEIATPMIVGSITTIGAFLSLLFISADAMHDFGLFAALSLLGTLLFVLIFLPHLFKNNKTADNHFFDKISDFRFEKNKSILFSILGLTILFLFFSSKVSFDTNLNKINYMTADQRKAFEELSNVSTVGKKSVYFVNEGKNLNEALKAYEQNKTQIESLFNTGKITGVTGIGSFLPSDSMQLVKIFRWNTFWSTRRDNVKAMLVSEGNKLGFKPESFNDFTEMVNAEYKVQPAEYFAPVTNNFVKDYLIVKDNRAMVITLLYTTPENAEKLNRFSYKDSFIFDQSSISKSLINILSNDFNKVLYICGLLVLIFLTFSFGRLELSFISFLPMVISWIWILGIMAIFGINFNIVNIILATFIFGLGDDYTIFMMDGMMNEYATKQKLLSSYKTAVALSSITMFIGIGTLVLAKHPAMKSLGEVTIIGMISVVLISYVIPALLFNYLTQRKGKTRLIPITFKQQFFTIYSFIAFLIGSIMLTLKGYQLFAFRKPTEKNKLKYHQHLCNFSNFVVRNIPLLKTRLLNEYNENFNKPSIIICNHQSHLDLMFLMMLSPKVVILTNEWVWNSPFYGKIIKFADFYPVANGIENSVDKLASLVERGYSIAIFPEGTRSEDCSILRFHRGAFFLAEKLGLDILPIVVHGIGHAFPKKEFLLRKGEVTVKILERIGIDNSNFGNNYSERAKLIRKYYKLEYDKLCDEFETPQYYADLVFHNYIYKGASIEKIARKQLSKYENFSSLINVLPHQGKLLHMNCGIGVFDLLCALVKKDLQITAIDNHEESILLAQNCGSKPNNLRYLNVVDTNSELYDFDAVLEINPKNDNIFQKCKLSKKVFYILADKSNPIIQTLDYKVELCVENTNSKVLVYDFSKLK